MKMYQAAITITLRRSILDVQGKTVEHALHSTDFPMIRNVRIGKHVELEIQAADADQAHALLNDACRSIIANPIMEDYHISLQEIASAEAHS
jgi:phosphoribosylformylglycinamidine synthase